MSDKNDDFHRLALKRVENVANALRIFSNLSGPSYEWDPAEVMAYVGQIEAALADAVARFQETKRWRTAAPAPSVDPAPHEPPPQTPDAPELSPAPAPDPVAEPAAPQRTAALSPEARRRLTIGQIIDEARDDREALAEMVFLQKQVIANLQSALDRARGHASENAAV